MRTIEVYHHKFNSAGSHTIELHEKPKAVLVKNMTDDIIKVSWGTQIHSEDYIQMPKDTGEVLFYQATNGDDLDITIQAMGKGDVEVRIISY